MNWLRLFPTIVVVLCLAGCGEPAQAQSTLLQGGPITPGHAPMYTNSGSSQAVVQDSGPAGGGAAGLGMGEGLYVARGTGTPPYVAQGTGPFGTNWCDYDAPLTNATGYHFLCLSANSQGGALITTGAGGTATPQPLYFDLNGVLYQFPAALSGIVGPAHTTVNDYVCWNNTNGTLVKDCGPVLSDNLVAAGTNQGTALPVIQNISSFGTVAAGTGAVLPTTTPDLQPFIGGYGIEVLNAGANPLLVYPPSGQSIEGQGANTPVTIYMNGDVHFTYRGLVAGLGAWYAR